MVTARQFALEFENRPALGGDDFVVAGANSEAVAWIDRWPDWPSVGTVIVGPTGSGKTHLTNVWQSRSSAQRTEFHALDTEAENVRLDMQQTMVVEGLDQVVGKRAETELLHIYNMLVERGGSILLTARIPPAQIPLTLADLASRIRALPVVQMQQPDDELLGAVLRKLFADRQLSVGHEVIRYLVRHGDRSFAAARRNVEALDRSALERKRDLTVSFVRDTLSNA